MSNNYNDSFPALPEDEVVPAVAPVAAVVSPKVSVAVPVQQARSAPPAKTSAAPPPSLMSTLFHPQTGGPPSRVTGDCIITTPEGAQLSLKAATMLGLVRLDALGNYSEVVGASLSGNLEGTPAAAEVGPEDTGPQAFPATEETAVREFAAMIPGPVLDAVTHQIITGFGVDSVDMTQAATAGFTPDLFRAGLQRAVAGFQVQADAAVIKAGAEPSAFYDWAKANAKEALNTAMRAHAASRSPSVYAPLIEKYLRAVPPTGEALQQAGIKTHRATGKGGAEMVVVNGMQMTSRVAARLGFI